MSIWAYKHSSLSRAFVERSVCKSNCVFCQEKLIRLRDITRRDGRNDGASLTGSVEKVEMCPTCGWWIINYHSVEKTGYLFVHDQLGAVAVLRSLDLADVSTPVADVQEYLAAKYSARYRVHPRTFENVVASVFKNLGYSARVTGYANDGGIDVVLDGPGDSLIGVQVKRYRSTVGVAQIRELTGALVIQGGFTSGMFVTTSKFSGSASAEAKGAGSHGYPVELVDAQRFLEALGLAQRRRYRSKRELLKTIGDPDLMRLNHSEYKRYDGD